MTFFRIPTDLSLRISVAACGTLLLLSLAGCGSGKKDPAADKGTNIQNTTVPIEAVTAVRDDLIVTKRYSASLEGEDQANIVPKISERITSIHAHVGDAVQAGQTVLLLDKSGASSQYYQAEAGFKNAEKTLSRMKSLYEEGAISLQSLDGTQTQFDVAKANFDAARSAVELTTPISGVVTAMNVNVGDLSMPGAVLATIAKIDKMKAIFNISEEEAANLAVGQKVQVYSETRQDAKSDGRVVQISKSADVKSRTFEIKALISNTRDRWLKPGMFCKVDVQLSPRVKALVVPNASIVSDGITSRVFVVMNGRAFQRPVTVGATDGDRSEILNGLAESEQIVTTGVTNVKDSSLVSLGQNK
jgi:RND family efflux transporter MFP subunit